MLYNLQHDKYRMRELGQQLQKRNYSIRAISWDTHINHDTAYPDEKPFFQLHHLKQHQNCHSWQLLVVGGFV